MVNGGKLLHSMNADLGLSDKSNGYVLRSCLEVSCMYFAPYIIHGGNAKKVPAQILPASTEDLAATKGQPTWQSDWESEYLNTPSVDKYALKLENGELVALGAYQVSGRKAYVYILYLESAPASNPTITPSTHRKYYGIGEVMIAFGIKYSIDAGCRGDVVFDAKTDELAQHYAKDFGAKRIPSGAVSGPKRFMLADEDAWKLFSKYLEEEDA